MNRSIAIVLVVFACDEKKEDPYPPRASTCLDYATALLGECFDAVRAAQKSELQCDSGLLEAGYNACNLSLEAQQPVCVPYRMGTGRMASSGEYTARHGCSAIVEPPAPKNWRGLEVGEAAEREP